MKLTEVQIKVLKTVADQRDWFLSAWCLGTRTCEALRKKGLLTHGGQDRPFTTGIWNNETVAITEAGRRALQEAERQ